MASLQHIAPIFPTADMDAMRAHYEALGFTVHLHGGGYGTAARDAVRIHFKLVPDLGPATERGAAYVGERRRHRPACGVVGGSGRRDLRPVRPRIRRACFEAAHTDGDGNLLRFGSPVRALTTGPPDGELYLLS